MDEHERLLRNRAIYERFKKPGRGRPPHDQLARYQQKRALRRAQRAALNLKLAEKREL